MIDDQHLCELHLHLDGSLSLETIKYLAEQQDTKLNGVLFRTETEELFGEDPDKASNDKGASDEMDDFDAELKKLLSVSKDCRDLNEYLEKFELPLSLLQTEEAISYAVKSIGLAEEELGVDYVEIRFAPQLHTRKGLTQREVIEAAADSAVYFNADHNTKIRLILCCMRGDDNREENLETVRLAAEFIHPTTSVSIFSSDEPENEDDIFEDSLSGEDLNDDNTGAASKMVYIPHVADGLLPVIAGVDLAGAEALYPTESFSDVFDLAKELKVPFTIHAGEAAGPESIWAAIKLGAKRIGHGVAAIKDEKLMEYLAENGIVLECCPTSNLNTKIFNDYAELPIKEFLERGIKVTVNTDNMTVSDTDIIREFEALTAVGLTDGERLMLLKNAESGWL